MTTIISNFLCAAAMPWLGYLIGLFLVWERPSRAHTAFFCRLSILFGVVCALAMALKDGAA
ncbi:MULTISPECIES: hypothetical protein [Klebsiella pneumoniae complex]|uniref:hypothetical protein n=1 Tax=Klebsiella pneumoniae complex TaxID=3390273 RepID=UPI001886CA60|nr:hypothetical protein [Klebsiella pneumoniae]MBD7259768.1 hypothetical protein [Klebsiella pneumoniae]